MRKLQKEKLARGSGSVALEFFTDKPNKKQLILPFAANYLDSSIESLLKLDSPYSTIIDTKRIKEKLIPQQKIIEAKENAMRKRNL